MAWVPWVYVPALVAINLVAWVCNPNSWPRRRLARGSEQRRARMLGITNRAAGVSKQQPPSCFWSWDLLDPTHCVTSLCVPKWVVLVVRLAGLAYFAAYFFVKEFADHDLKPTWLTFFTNWSFVAFALSMLLGAAHSACHIRSRRRCSDGKGQVQGQQPGSGAPSKAASEAAGPGEATECRNEECRNEECRNELLASNDSAADAELALPGGTAGGSQSYDLKAAALALNAGDDEGLGNGTRAANAGCSAGEGMCQAVSGASAWTLLAKAHLLCVEVACSAELFLTAFYWALLYSGSSDGLATNIMVHGVNNLFMLADVVLSRLPFVTYHFQVVLLYGSTYLVFMWIYFGASGEWTYDTLDWSKSVSMVYYLLLPCLLALAFSLYYGVAQLREWLARRRRRKAVAQAAAVGVAATLPEVTVELQPGFSDAAGRP